MKNINGKHWALLIGCMLIQAIPYGLAQNVPPLYIAPLTNVYHFDLSKVSLMFTFGAVFAAVVSPVAGKFFGKKPTKILCLLGLAVSIVGMIVQATANRVELFWVANMLIQAGCIVFSGLAVPYLIGSWFEGPSRPTAMGIAFSGGSIGNFVLQPIFTGLFAEAMKPEATISCQQIFWLIAIAFAVLGALIILIFIKDNKADKTPNQNYSEQMEEVANDISEKGCGFAKTKTMAAYWIMGVAMAIIGLNIAAQSAQYNVFFTNINLSEFMGSDALYNAVGSVFAIGCLIGNVLGGILFGKLGVFKSVMIGFAFQFLSALVMVILSVIDLPTTSHFIIIMLPFAWALLYGLSVFTYTSGPSVIIQTLFGMKDFGETVGMFNIFFAVGFALGAFIFSMFVKFGWNIAWLTVLIYVIVGYGCMLMSIKKVEHLHLADQE